VVQDFRTGSEGLTLLEMVIALFLTGLLSLVAFASLNLSLRAVSRGQTEAEILQRLRITQSILERSLGSAVPWITVDRKRTYYFEGNPEDLRFMTTVPLAAHDLGGLYYLRVYVPADEPGQALTAEQSKLIRWLSDPSDLDVRQVLIPNTSAFHFTYGVGGESWKTWKGEERQGLPEWVKVEVTVAGHPPQAWFIPINTAEEK